MADDGEEIAGRRVKIVLFGATGMVGRGVLRQCLLDTGVESVLCIGRKPSGVMHPKLRDLIRADMFDFNIDAAEFNGYDACFFCLGVSSAGMSEAEYTHLTYDLTMGWAHAFARVNPAMSFPYVSGMGTGGKQMWAQVKGRVETELLALFPSAYMIRLGALRPMHGERSKAPYGFLLTVFAPFWSVFQWLMPRTVITTEELGRAMIRVVRESGSKHVLESQDLVALGRPGTV
jgi:nucleoside-diphosphate-sugar epimerase